ncbi:hypothetical protein L6E12_05030 [Actinokineospora sp. PR83]|uniref:hypothetical protein n=1 Tax=Actinokineospora sp. PR83 TaxID=2884908 RepID=UPI001F3CCFD8|nr:hypothetical protein [Actinokineospora sp. PR83]MCG8915154.1 hypothetical protein [Actinokineospora sp. PR83]
MTVSGFGAKHRGVLQRGVGMGQVWKVLWVALVAVVGFVVPALTLKFFGVAWAAAVSATICAAFYVRSLVDKKRESK